MSYADKAIIRYPDSREELHRNVLFDMIIRVLVHLKNSRIASSSTNKLCLFSISWSWYITLSIYPIRLTVYLVVFHLVLLGAELSSTRGDLGLMSVTVFGSQAQLSSARCQAGSEACWWRWWHTRLRIYIKLASRLPSWGDSKFSSTWSFKKVRSSWVWPQLPATLVSLILKSHERIVWVFS